MKINTAKSRMMLVFVLHAIIDVTTAGTLAKSLSELLWRYLLVCLP